jgi:hypothetical protein
LYSVFNLDARLGLVNANPRRFTPSKRNPVPIVQEAGWAPGPVWTGEENVFPIEFQSPDHPVHTDSLYRLREIKINRLKKDRNKE